MKILIYKESKMFFFFGLVGGGSKVDIVWLHIHILLTFSCL